MDHQRTDPFALQRAVRFVALLNLGYFEIEFVVARAIAARCVGFTAVAR
jgi:hypothetical protein